MHTLSYKTSYTLYSFVSGSVSVPVGRFAVIKWFLRLGCLLYVVIIGPVNICNM